MADTTITISPSDVNNIINDYAKSKREEAGITVELSGVNELDPLVLLRVMNIKEPSVDDLAPAADSIRFNAKKTHAAFRRLELSTADRKPKAKKATRLSKPTTVAEALRLAFGAGKPSRAEQIVKNLGYYLFMYYKYKDYFKSAPSSLDDMIDGLIYINLISRED